jgi:DNA-binding MarR family transcriptional regulator
LGVRIRLVSWDKAEKLPLFLTDRFDFFRITLFDRPYTLAYDRETEPTSPAALYKQLEVVRKKGNTDVVYVCNSLTSWNRTRLIEKKQSFIVPENQLYLPLLGMDLREYTRLPEKKTDLRSLGPSSVRALLYILYHADRNDWTLAELSLSLGISTMSVSRTFDEFGDTGLFTIEKSGKTRVLHRTGSGIEVWSRAMPFLRTPVMKKAYVVQDTAIPELPRSGITALSEKTIMVPPQIPEYAISSASWKELSKKKGFREVPTADMNTVLLEIWRYDPAPFAREGMVDPLSLYLSLKDSDDARVENALQELMGGVEW